ncbi:MAG: aminopeptidase P family protein [Candidatus Aenigmarchaeota archaeon]|nr:aminopeptidase P family protein [Candidatus Aenigmarchaeota archaeon]
MSEIRKRLKKLDELEGKVDSVLVINRERDPNFFYLTGLDITGAFYYDFSETVILTSEMEAGRARKSGAKNVVVVKKFGEFLGKGRTRKIGIDAKGISLSAYRRLKIRGIDISAYLSKMRAVKSRGEIKNIKEACKIAARIMEKAVGEISPKITEWELKSVIECGMLKKGVEPSFPTIVETAENISPHHAPGNRKLKEPVLIDLGVRYNGYCSDITRTVGSSFENIIEKVFAEVEEELKPGAAAADIDKKARQVMGKYSRHFLHSLGHGIGIEVHENPSLSKASNDVMKAGMTFTIEPGIYIKGGMRHEEDYILTERGAVKLT